MKTTTRTKPFAKTTEEILEHIDIYRPVRVYRNLHKQCCSIQQGGIVKCHANEVQLSYCTFIVSQAGRARVIAEGKKNVHAYVDGYVFTGKESLSAIPSKGGGLFVGYNPRKMKHWTRINPNAKNKIVDTARYVDIYIDHEYCHVIAYQIRYLD